MIFDLGIANCIILSRANGYRPFIGSVGVSDGKFAWVTDKIIQKSSCREYVDGTGKILMPGLINAHCHGDMTFARGFGDGLSLKDQNEKFADTNWFYSLINEEDRKNARLLTYIEALESGTTCMMENMYWSLGDDSAEIMKQAGIRGALAEDIRRNFAEPDNFIEDADLDRFSNTCKAAGILPFIGGISEEDFEEQRILRIRETARKHGIPITCHLAETTWREEIVRKKYDTTSIRYLASLDALGPNVLGSHVVWADQDEIAILADTKTNVVNTPLCEMKIRDGIAPITAMVKRGVNVCLGTDGAMWNNSNDIFREMKGMALLQSVKNGPGALQAAQILDMATYNGAAAMGIAEQTGSIEEGKAADFILVNANASHMQPLSIGTCENVTSMIVYNAAGQDVTDVWVKGKGVVRNSEWFGKKKKKQDVIQKVREAYKKVEAFYGK